VHFEAWAGALCVALVHGALEGSAVCRGEIFSAVRAQRDAFDQQLFEVLVRVLADVAAAERKEGGDNE
jgi:hypothetical protein